MSEYIGDFIEDFATVSFKFLTSELASNAAAIPYTLAGSPVISVYTEGNLVQTIVGITLTVDFDGITGLNHVLIDLSADAFYVPNANYDVVITVGTINALSTVGRVVASFSIENRSLQKALSVVSNIATGAAAASVPAESRTLTTGTEVNTVASTVDLDGGYHEISDVAGGLEFYYQFDINVNRKATSVAMNGRLEGKDDLVGVYAWNWGTTSWDQIGSMIGQSVGSTDGVVVFTMIEAHTGISGVDEGKVRIRGLGVGLTGSTMYIDRAVVRFASNPAPTAIQVRTEMDDNSTKLATLVTDLANSTDGLGALKILIDAIDTVVDGIKSKTDLLTFTKALELDVNTKSMNGSTIVGDGQTTPWEGQ